MRTSKKRTALTWNTVLAGAVFAATAVGCAPSDGGNGTPGSGGAASGGSSATGGAVGSGGSLSTGGSPGSGGSPATGGSPGSGGSSATGGLTGSGGSGSGGQATGGTIGSGGTSSTGGRGGTGTGGAGGAGGGMTGGRGGANGGAGGTDKVPAQPSTGCGKANPQTGSSGSPLMISNHQYYLKLPTSYDANKPYPVLFIFNPTNNPISWAEQSAGFEMNGAKDAAIRVYPHPQNSSSGWGASDVAFFQPLYDQVTANFCIDKARAFAAGESSGGDFSSILGCEHANKLRSVGPCATKPVGGYALDAATRKCTGQVTPVVIHGKNDNVVGPENGPKTRDFYVALNHCSNTTQPVAGFTDTLSNCVQYQGCDAGYPVYWCLHTDPNYSNTNHGWPAFAPKMLWQLWSSY